MQYNLHPIFVHFPIALLAIYSAIKILPMRKWLPKVAWGDIERILLVIGTLGTFAALATGDTAKHLFQPNRQLVGAHSDFAVIATLLYSALLLGEILAYIARRPAWLEKLGKTVSAVIVGLQPILFEGWVPKFIALIAFIALAITGLLGGAIVYGATADPFVPVVLKLLGITL